MVKLRQAKLCFITGCFLMTFKMIINNSFLFIKLNYSTIFAFCYQGYQQKNWEQQIVRNCKLDIYFKNDFNLSVMNVIELNFLN